jgi:hypothetical protein
MAKLKYPGFLIFLTILVSSVSAQEKSSLPFLGPLNSDPLAERGISPRVLDIALFPLSQGLFFEMMVSYRATLPNGYEQEQFRMVFNPKTDHGRDVYIEFENEPLLSVKEYRRSLEVTMGADYWVRKQTRIYDPKSLRVIERNDGHEVISFRYDKDKVPTKQRWLLKLEGRLHIQNGVLQRIDYIAKDTIQRDGVRNENYRSSVVFGAVPDLGGYVIDQMEEQFSLTLNRKVQHIRIHSRVTKYNHSELGNISWTHMPTELIAGNLSESEEESINQALVKILPEPVTREVLERKFESTSTIKLDLHRALPLWADDVRKMGFELPKTYGLGAIGMIQNGDFEITDIGIGGISAVNDIPLLERLGNNTNSNITTVQARADVWVLPFLNLSVMGGNLETDSDVTLHFTPLFQSLYKLKTGDDLPAMVTAPAATTATTLGVGLTTGFKYESLVMSAALTYAETITNETNSQIDALVFIGLAGYDFGDLGMQLLAGVQYLDADRTISGSINIGEGVDPLLFSVELNMEETLFMVGINKDIGRNWNLTAFVGLNGTREQATVMFGYRF